MKIRFFLLGILAGLIFTFSDIVPAISGKGYVLHSVAKKDVREWEDVFKRGELGPVTQEDLKKEQVKFFDATHDIVFDKTAFHSADYFYVGAGPAVGINIIKSSSLMRAYIQRGAEPLQDSVQFIPLALQQANVNGAQEDVGRALEPNPIYDKRITNLTLIGRNPVMTFAVPNPLAPGPDDNKKIVLVDWVEQSGRVPAGSSVKINTENITDANANATAGIVGLAASFNTIFAAVRPGDPLNNNFGDFNSGIAVVVQKENKLKAINAVTGNQDENRAFGISTAAMPAGGFISTAIDNDSQIGGFGDMYWDSTLQRLFIALTNVARANDAQNAGAISLLVGRKEGEAWIIDTAVGRNAALFPNAAHTLQYIFGFYSAANQNVGVAASVHKIRTMHTSTGKSYLIVNAGVGVGDIRNEVYALPIVKTGDAVNVGKIANKNNVDVVVGAAADMTRNDEVQAIVGRGVASISALAAEYKIQDMFVVGDSVFVCVAQDRVGANREAGIFRSTAMFDNNGLIRGWTSWQRVMGNSDKVFGAGVDSNLGNYWYLTQDGAGNKNTVRVTQWGKSVAQNGLMGNGLVALLAQEFPQQNGGVHQIFNFDEQTPTLSRINAADNVSMIVATGFEKIALINSGAGNPLTPPLQFRKDNEVFIIEDGVLENIGPVCIAEISRLQAANSGWLLVGGDGGVAVLSRANGNGWPSDPGDGALDFADLANNFTFKQLVKNDGSIFSQVRKLICDGRLGGADERLYIMTADNIYRVAMNANKFRAAPLPLNPRQIAKPSGALLDMLIVYNDGGGNVRLLVATTHGLFLSNNILPNDADQDPVWNPVLLHSGAQMMRPVVHLYFISTTKGGSTTDGNLYCLAADFSLNLANIYRFNVENGIVTAITEPGGTDDFYSIGELRSNFVTDGAIGFHMFSKHFGRIAFLKRLSMISTKSLIRNGEQVIELDLDENAYNSGIMVQNTASGAWIVPGDWGIRLNE